MTDLAKNSEQMKWIRTAQNLLQYPLPKIPVLGDNFPFAIAQGAVAKVFPCERRSPTQVLTMQRRHETYAFHRLDVLAIELLGTF